MANDQEIKILGISEMFPSNVTAHMGTFVIEQCREVSSFCEIRFLSPRFISPLKTAGTAWMAPYARMRHESVIQGIRSYRCSVLALPFYYTMFFQTVFSVLCMVPYALSLRRSYRYNLIHAHGLLPGGLTAVILGKMLGIPVVLTCHGSDVNVYPKKAFLKLCSRYVLRHVQKVTTVSQDLAKKVVDLGARRDRVQFVPNGIAPEMFPPIKTLSYKRQRIIFMGRLIPEKGVRELLEAINILWKHHIDVDLHVVGDGPLRSLVEAISDDRLVWHGFLSHARAIALLSTADVLCHPSYQEGWGHVCVEAHACGIPVVASDIPTLREIIYEDSLGIRVPVRNGKLLFEALRSALNNDWDRDAIVKSTRRYHWNDLRESYRTIYTSLLQTQGVVG